MFSFVTYTCSGYLFTFYNFTIIAFVNFILFSRLHREPPIDETLIYRPCIHNPSLCEPPHTKDGIIMKMMCKALSCA